MISPVSQPVSAAAAAAAGASLAAEASSFLLMRNIPEAAAAAASQQHLDLYHRSSVGCDRSVLPPLVEMEDMSPLQRHYRLTAAVSSCSDFGANEKALALVGNLAAATPGEVSSPDQTAAGSAPARTLSPSHPSTAGITSNQDLASYNREQSPLRGRLSRHEGNKVNKENKCRRKKDKKVKHVSTSMTGADRLLQFAISATAEVTT